ncbi:unnamed protein product [Zymoseptoria tritici ST99CH_3D7]|uniref:Glycosyl hydrolase family 13 catalytic domain-containing protein n=1 Tax=Zymoseptoria tritici (strain ST99CH_3D7) TaxID=1276538 RepID=A0A1X7RLB7_ZYMT9|nr:unnamed protein product [Zymoseptoria tritici ST99CH_3D7]
MAYNRPPPPPPPSSRPPQSQHPSPYQGSDRPPHPPPTPANTLLLQSFEWHTPSPHPTTGQSHYVHLTNLLPSLVENLGITHLWLPPGCKANDPSGRGNGYDCYDLWDLGEFDQKWRRETKWGSKEELMVLLEKARELRVEVIWDAVLGHKTAGDEIDLGEDGSGVWAVEVEGSDRHHELCPPKEIHPWLKFNFPGRLNPSNSNPASTFQWNATHFSGVDWCDREKRNAIFKLISDPATHPRPNPSQLPFPIPGRADGGLNRFVRFAEKVLPRGKQARRPGRGWAEDVDQSNGNNNYLMFSSIDYTHPTVRSDTLSWSRWMITTTGISGFRLDAAQHISRSFLRDFIATSVSTNREAHSGRDPFIVAEVWTPEVANQITFLDGVTPSPDVLVRVFDTPLLNNFARISSDVVSSSPNADLRTILVNSSDPAHASLVSLRPSQAVTFVANHDTQAGQSMETSISPDLKLLFYAFILLRKEGTPCVFWGDLYGTQGPHGVGPACQVPAGDGGGSTRSLLPTLCLARKLFAYGEQRDYFDESGCIAWTRAGTWDREGCCVVLSLGGGWRGKRMWVDRGRGERWVDLLSGRRVSVGGDGWRVFEVKGRGVGVWVREGAEGVGRFVGGVEGMGRE